MARSLPILVVALGARSPAHPKIIDLLIRHAYKGIRPRLLAARALFRSPCKSLRGLPRFCYNLHMQIVFLDEFGHIGPFVSRSDKKYNHSPVFGLAGFALPHDEVRSFSTWFFQFKNSLLAGDLKASAQHPATWEKKGSELISTRNIKKYPAIREGVDRLINRIYRADGKLFFYGREKYQSPQDSKPSGLYTTCMGHTVRQLDRYSIHRDRCFMMILDQHSDRLKLLETAAKTMFGANPARKLVEAPFQVESHLYQTVQAADWIAALVGRVMAYRVAPSEYADWEWAERLYGARIDAASTHSKLWRPASAQAVTPKPALTP